MNPHIGFAIKKVGDTLTAVALGDRALPMVNDEKHQTKRHTHETNRNKDKTYLVTEE